MRAKTVRAGRTLVSAQQVSVGYDGNPVCAPATFTLEPGQVLAMVGINGAGKSTLLRTCCGMLKPLDGRVELLGLKPDPRSATQRAAVAADMGEASFFPSLSVAEHLRLVCLGHRVPQADQAVEDILIDLDLTRQAHALPDALSSGQRRRLALAAALIRPRRLLVLDEPEQRLDHTTRLLLADRLTAERQAGGGVLMASHDPDLVAACATAVLLVGSDTRLMSVDEGVDAIHEGLS
ncbi:ATP-binding cassette domain-containing protein [Actinomyces slackii]|uniref:ABC-type transporter ATP-binding protein EcsA n=1 Tax=Actinomyces slackii TaxID=52774 RepID=A0A3S5EMB5_9ACTO|nr:ATP-binding cassette domain-containing protein [Actinomyces slackii]VEG75492.1 ABC-type transporter ATP-binding protein EcsA [Actinomyces slackii]